MKIHKETWNLLCDFREKTSIVTIVCCIVLILNFLKILTIVVLLWCFLYLILCLVVGKGNIMEVKREKR